MTEAEAMEKLKPLIARRNALYERGLDPDEDLAALPGMILAADDPNIGLAEFMELFERHVAALEAAHPHRN